MLQALKQMGFPIPESYGRQRRCHTMGLHRNGIPRWRKLLLYTPGIRFGTSGWWRSYLKKSPDFSTSVQQVVQTWFFQDLIQVHHVTSRLIFFSHWWFYASFLCFKNILNVCQKIITLIVCLSYLKISFELWKLQNTHRFLVLQTDCYVERTKLETV